MNKFTKQTVIEESFVSGAPLEKTYLYVHGSEVGYYIDYLQDTGYEPYYIHTPHIVAEEFYDVTSKTKQEAESMILGHYGYSDTDTIGTY